jgi:hypothetical protein
MPYKDAEIWDYVNDSQRKCWTNDSKGRKGCLPRTMIDGPVRAVRDGFTRAVESGALTITRKKEV